MSIELMNRVFDSNIPSTHRFILLVLADFANHEGQCYPLKSTLVKRTGFSKETVKKSLRWLRENGYIEARERKAHNGGSQSNEYFLFPEGGVSDTGGSLVPPGGVCSSPHNHQLTKESTNALGTHSNANTKGASNVPSAYKYAPATEQEHFRSLALFEEALDDWFEVFWIEYPRQRRGSRTKARSAFGKAVRRDSYENIMKGLKAYSKSREVSEGYAKGAAAWLNDDRWTNEYEPPPGQSVGGKTALGELPPVEWDEGWDEMLKEAEEEGLANGTYVRDAETGQVVPAGVIGLREERRRRGVFDRQRELSLSRGQAPERECVPSE